MQQLISWSKKLAVLHFKQEITEIIAILLSTNSKLNKVFDLLID